MCFHILHYVNIPLAALHIDINRNKTTAPWPPAKKELACGEQKDNCYSKVYEAVKIIVWG